jgi:predicted dehydrogenase
MRWIGEIGTVQAMIGRTPDFLTEAPSAVIWRFKDKNCLGMLDYTYAPQMVIRGKYVRVDEFFKVHGSRGVIWVTRCSGEMLDLPPVMLRKGTETVSYQVPMDWIEGFNGAARDFVDSILQGRRPELDARTSKKILQVALAIYEAARTERPVAPASMT